MNKVKAGSQPPPDPAGWQKHHATKCQGDTSTWSDTAKRSVTPAGRAALKSARAISNPRPEGRGPN